MPRGLAAVIVVLAAALASGCGCNETLYPTRCRLRERAAKTLSCDDGNKLRSDQVRTDTRSTDDADTYTICCAHGARACIVYVCPRGRPETACYRD